MVVVLMLCDAHEVLAHDMWSSWYAVLMVCGVHEALAHGVWCS